MTCSLIFSASVAFGQDAYDAEATASLEATVDAGFASMSTGNYDVLRATSEEVKIYDLDNLGQPFVAAGLEYNGRLDLLTADLRAVGLTVDYNVLQRDCHATATLGYCTVEYETSVESTLPASVRWRVTIVARKVEDGWTYVHMHNSMGPQPPVE